MGLGHEIEHILVSGQGSAYCGEMIDLVGTIWMGAGDIEFASDNGFDAIGFTFVDEIDGTVHDAVIRDGDCLDIALGDGFDELIYAAGSVEDAVLRMNMQMNESGSHEDSCQ